MTDNAAPPRSTITVPERAHAGAPHTLRAYDLNGITLTVAAADQRVAAFLDPILAPLQCTPPAQRDWIATVSAAESIEPPVDGRIVFSGPLPEGLPAIMIDEGEGRRLVVPNHFEMILRRRNNATEIRFIPGTERGLGGTAAFWMLSDILAARGRRLLHGGVLVDPETDGSIVLFAPSGTGKTTTALALARSGLHLAGDDALVLDTTQTCAVWAIPRRLNIHRRTVALLPWLAAVTTGAWTGDERSIELGALSGLVPVASPRQRPVRLVVVLTPPNDSGHAVTPIARPEALSAIISDNLRTAPGGVDADNTATLAALAKLVGTTPVVAFSVGPNLASLSRAVLPL
jgi:hypothetical protein